MFKKVILCFLLLILLVGIFFFIGKPTEEEKIAWGVNFSQKHAENLGLAWQEVYSVLIYELGAENIKLIVHWDLIEPEKGKYDFNDLDWQIELAEKEGIELLLVVGMKTPRWPECHIPEWAQNLSKEEQQEEILTMLEKTILRYRESPAVWAWQVENEPFFSFGNCPWQDEDFLKKEIELVKSLDKQERPVVISDSGEYSFWFRSAKLGDIVATTMYKKIWFSGLKIYVTYPLPPAFYSKKAKIIKNLFNKKVICGELQAEPWGPQLLYDSPLEEQKKTMNLDQFKKNIEFAKKTGFDKFYLWGAEWWYWLKEKHGQPEIWSEAKKIF